MVSDFFSELPVKGQAILAAEQGFFRLIGQNALVHHVLLTGLDIRRVGNDQVKLAQAQQNIGLAGGHVQAVVQKVLFTDSKRGVFNVTGVKIQVLDPFAFSFLGQSYRNIA